VNKLILFSIFLFFILFLNPVFATSDITDKDRPGEECSCGHEHEADPAEHIHAEGEECPFCNHENHGETGDAHNHSEGSCGLEYLHDPYLMESIIQQPWRHPEEIGRELWMKKIAPLCGLFLLAVFLRPLFNKTLRKVSK